jgi:hypothetical protein
MADECRIRASDSDRESTTGVLRDAYAAGRLTLQEFLERIGTACSATTWGQLYDLTTDLPESRWLFPSPDAGLNRERAELSRSPKRPFAPLWVTAVIWLAIAAAAHVVASIPLIVLAVFVLRTAHLN